MENVLKLQDVTHVYVNASGTTLAVERLSLAVAKGEFVSLVGPSGCGKTTVLSLLAGLILPTEGIVSVGGEKILKPSPKIGYMLQQDYLLPWRTILSNVLLGLEISGSQTPEAVDYARSLLEQLGLGGMERRMPHELSGGMRQRAALVRTLATRPDVLLLDEPFSALDLQIKLQLEDLVQTTLRRLSKTAVLVTHDLGEAAAMSDRVFVLGANPGHVSAVFDMPESISGLLPTEARKLPEFQERFEEIWQALEQASGKGGET
ncbi:ABC transporter ATP-binding protein [Paenibacillus sepulcri]|uniref:ABC transporter ATP-binding protein n=1 Tax=Paenibacillus sepulcri TaxID=359917 RepID=UPI001AE5BE32